MNASMDDSSPTGTQMTAWFEMLHLADSALPIGGQSHSFGVESLVAEAGLTEPDLERFFREWLHGTGLTEATFCVRAWAAETADCWHDLNLELSAFKPARESREAGLRLGRRFLSLAATLIPNRKLSIPGDAHLATAFGLVGCAIGAGPELAAAAFLHQTLFSAVSGCQRLLPLGQTRAMRLLWALKPAMAEVVQTAMSASSGEPPDLWNLQPSLEIASMRHPHLATRLFIS